MNILSESQIPNFPPVPKLSSNHHWCLLRNVLRAVALFKTTEAKEAYDLNELIASIEHIPTDQSYQEKAKRNMINSAYNQALDELRREQNMKRYIERGDQEDLMQIKIEIEMDPYKKLHNTSHPLSLLNKRNKSGQTPLYVACKNGNLAVIMLLLTEGADYLLESLVDGEEESNLEVAVRWRHKRVVIELLKLKWPKAVYLKAKTLGRNSEIEALFNKYSKKKWNWCCCSKA